MIFLLYTGTSALIIFLTSREQRNIVQLCTSVSQDVYFLYASLFLGRWDQITASPSTSVTWSHILAGGDREGGGEAKSLEIQSNYIQIIYSNVVKAALSIFDLA